MDGDFVDIEAVRTKIHELLEEHEALDAAVAALAETGVLDQLKVARLKKRKLQIKDQIAHLEDKLNPDIIA